MAPGRALGVRPAGPAAGETQVSRAPAWAASRRWGHSIHPAPSLCLETSRRRWAQLDACGSGPAQRTRTPPGEEGAGADTTRSGLVGGSRPWTGSAEELGLCTAPPGPAAGARPCRCQPSHCRSGLVTAGDGGRASQDIASVGRLTWRVELLRQPWHWRGPSAVEGRRGMTAWTPHPHRGSERGRGAGTAQFVRWEGNYQTVSSIKPSHGFCEHPYAH